MPKMQYQLAPNYLYPYNSNYSGLMLHDGDSCLLQYYDLFDRILNLLYLSLHPIPKQNNYHGPKPNISTEHQKQVPQNA